MRYFGRWNRSRQSESDAVRVAVRVRPMSEREIAAGLEVGDVRYRETGTEGVFVGLLEFWCAVQLEERPIPIASNGR